VHPPPGAVDDSDVPAWLVGARRFRAGVLFSDGLRPTFRGPDGEFHDDDPADLFAHHVVATAAGVPVATLRVIPLAATQLGFCERLLGRAPLERLLENIGTERADAWEGSGWAVRPGRRRATIGATVLAAGSAIAREIGLRHAIGASGSRYGQLYRILAAGYHRAPAVDPIPVPGLADDVQVVHGTLDTLRPGFQALVEQTADLLRWSDHYPTRVNRMTS
jgi:hypothetical protein